jgi:hypothetical protein
MSERRGRTDKRTYSVLTAEQRRELMELPMPEVRRYGGMGWSGLSSVDRVPLMPREYQGYRGYRRRAHSINEAYERD